MRLEAKDLSFRYHKGNRQILNHVSVSLDSSDRLGLAAPSGFGKTTFCKILAGYEQPDEGQVLLDGKPLHFLRLPILKEQDKQQTDMKNQKNRCAPTYTVKKITFFIHE